MAATVPSLEPSVIIAGDTATWKKSLGDYSAADGWVLSYTLTTTSLRYTFTAAASGTDHLVTVLAATTAAWTPGTYAAQGRATLTTAAYTVFQGSVIIKPNLAAASTGYDGRTFAAKMVDALKVMIYATAGNKTNSCKVNDQQFDFKTDEEKIEALVFWENALAKEIDDERIAQGKPSRRYRYTQFSR